MADLIRMMTVGSLAEALDLAAQHTGTAVIDLDGTLVPTGAALDNAAKYTDELWTLNDAVTPAVILTNRRSAPPQLVGYPVVSHARKPLTPRSLMAPYEPISLVIGDQIGTDGLLAARLNVPYLHIPHTFDQARPIRTRASESIFATLLGHQSKPTRPAEARLAMPLRDTDPQTHEKWVTHVTGLYQLEYQLLGLAVAVATVGIPFLISLLYNLPPSTPQPVFLVAPLAPTLFLMLLMYFFFNSRIVGVYARAIERLIAASSSDVGDLAPSELHAPALARLSGALYGGERRGLLFLRVFFLIMATLVLTACFGTSFYVLWRVDDERVRNIVATAYTLFWAFLFAAYAVGVSHRTDTLVIESALLRDSKKARPQTLPRTWGSFLGFVLLPRPASLSKCLDGVIIAFSGWLLNPLIISGSRSDFADLRRVLLGIIFFEVILYQTRYLLNGLREDSSSGLQLPADRRNNDLNHPFSPEQLMAGPLFACARLAIFVWTCAYGHVADPRASLTAIGLFLVAFYTYEVPREVARIHLKSVINANRNTYASRQIGRVPNMVSAELKARLALGIRRSRVTFLTAGLGYALRVAFILYVLEPRLLFSWVGIALIVAFWAGRCASVGAGWAIEFSGALSITNKNAIHRNIVAKPHLAWAAQSVPGLTPESPEMWNFDKSDARESAKNVLMSAPFLLRAPWRIMWFVSIVSLGLLALSTPASLESSGALLLGLVAVGLTGLTSPLFRSNKSSFEEKVCPTTVNGESTGLDGGTEQLSIGGSEISQLNGSGLSAAEPNRQTTTKERGGSFGRTGLIVLLVTLVGIAFVFLAGDLRDGLWRVIVALALCSFWLSNALAASEGGQLSKLIEQAEALLRHASKFGSGILRGLHVAAVLLLGSSVTESLNQRLGNIKNP